MAQQAPTCSLAELPLEILDLIISKFDALSDLSHLSLTCRQVHVYIELYGYRAFIREHFPLYRFPPAWKAAARRLTGITKSWESRNLFARSINPPNHAAVVHQASPAIIPSSRANSHYYGGQSIGYPAVVACREVWDGGQWQSRRETLAIGAGAELRIRSRSMAPEVDKSWLEASLAERKQDYDQFRHRQRWTTYKDGKHQEGRCDITTVNLIPNTENDGEEVVIYGRACGALEKMVVNAPDMRKETLETQSGSIRFSDTSPNGDLLVAGQPLRLSLYNYSGGEHAARAVSDLRFEKEGRLGQLWTGRFVNQSEFILGRDSKAQPLASYTIRPEGIQPLPTWKLPSSTNFTGVKAVSPVGSIDGIGSSSNMLLSAWKSGNVTLHDLRTPQTHVSRFSDNTDMTTVFYSLLPLGTERFLAGSNKHGYIRVFDMRVTGAKSYSTLDLRTSPAKAACNAQPQREQARPRTNGHGNYRLTPGSQKNNFALFMCQSHSGRMHHRRGHFVPFVDVKNSSVYHLAAGSTYAPTFYAGLEGTVVQFDLVSASDPFPDATFAKTQPPPSSLSVELEKWLDPQKRQILLRLIEDDRPNTMFAQSWLGFWSS